MYVCVCVYVRACVYVRTFVFLPVDVISSKLFDVSFEKRLYVLIWTTLWSRILLEKLIILQLTNKEPTPTFTESEGLLPCSQESPTGPYPDPHEFSPYCHILGL
jgi:hypothetical protein